MRKGKCQCEQERPRDSHAVSMNINIIIYVIIYNIIMPLARKPRLRTEASTGHVRAPDSVRENVCSIKRGGPSMDASSNHRWEWVLDPIFVPRGTIC